MHPQAVWYTLIQKQKVIFFLTFRSSIVLSYSLTLTLVILEIQSYANCLNLIEREINPNTISSFFDKKLKRKYVVENVI